MYKYIEPPIFCLFDDAVSWIIPDLDGFLWYSKHEHSFQPILYQVSQYLTDSVDAQSKREEVLIINKTQNYTLYYTYECVQWNLSKPDTIGTNKSVHYREGVL